MGSFLSIGSAYAFYLGHIASPSESLVPFALTHVAEVKLLEVSPRPMVCTYGELRIPVAFYCNTCIFLYLCNVCAEDSVLDVCIRDGCFMPGIDSLR